MMVADPARVAAARAALAGLGVTVADLLEAQRPRVPTFAEYLPRVMAAAGPGARRTYGSYWIRMAARWADRPITAVIASELEALKQQTTAGALPRRNARGGRHAGEHVIAAARAFYSLRGTQASM
jgi:hypothetical protein